MADLMSRSVRTVTSDALLADIIHDLRRIGHEGYPVLDASDAASPHRRTIGLLTLRDADRALEHGLTDSTVREVMSAGNYALTPHNTVAELAQLMVESGWGQIPVIDQGRLVGIVTRTDLIRHLARFYRTTAAPHITPEMLQAVLGASAAALIEQVMLYAQERGVTLYLVGGVVRDLLLRRPNFDIDFVVESDDGTLLSAAEFARGLQKAHGGEVTAYAPFGTAKWKLEGTPFVGEALPHHIDFASARRELYQHPTALPTVSGGSIKLDLGRRDFTINALAVQLSPESGRVLDFFGGLPDLERGMIRVLHSLSFVEDPTRILRAVRFAQRLRFTIEARTDELIVTSLPMLRRITGERVRNELHLLMQEAEPERGLSDLNARGALAAVHPFFTFDPRTGEAFAAARAIFANSSVVAEHASFLQRLSINLPDLYWHIAFAAIADRAKVAALCERLLFGKSETESLSAAAGLFAECQSPDSPLRNPNERPSQLVRHFESTGVTELALAAVWVICEDSLTRTRIEDYITIWRSLRPTTDGHRLRAAGLPPGPRYRQILERLRAARLDGEVTSDESEERLLRSLIEDNQP